MSKLLRCTLLGFVLYVTIFLVVYPKTTLEAARTAIELCLDTIIPSLFPFFVCSGLLSSLGFSALCSRILSPLMRKLFNLPGCCALAFFLGLVSGYPVGAYTAADLYSKGQCTKIEAEHMTAFCNNSGPLFVIGVVGTAFLKSPVLGYFLYISHILSAVIVGFFLRFYKAQERKFSRELPPSLEIPKKEAVISFGNVIDSSVFSTLKVCGFVIFFSVFTSTLPSIPLKPILYSTAEITGGINELSQLETSTSAKLSLISFFLAFSGLSVLFQVSAIATPKGISLCPYVFGKTLQGLLSALITNILVRFVPSTISVFLPWQGGIPTELSPTSVFFASLITALLTALVLGLFMLAVTYLSNKNPK